MTKTPAGQDANATRVQPAQAGGDDPFGLAPWLREMPDVPLHPLMAHPVAAMAATTAIGFGIAGQMAGAMLGLMQSAAERAKAALDEAAAQAQPVEPVRTKPVLTVVPKAEEPAIVESASPEFNSLHRRSLIMQFFVCNGKRAPRQACPKQEQYYIMSILSVQRVSHVRIRASLPRSDLG